MFEPLKLQEAYVTIRNKYPQLDALLFGPEFFVKAHQIYDQMQVQASSLEFCVWIKVLHWAPPLFTVDASPIHVCLGSVISEWYEEMPQN